VRPNGSRQIPATLLNMPNPIRFSSDDNTIVRFSDNTIALGTECCCCCDGAFEAFDGSGRRYNGKRVSGRSRTYDGPSCDGTTNCFSIFEYEQTDDYHADFDADCTLVETPGLLSLHRDNCDGTSSDTTSPQFDIGFGEGNSDYITGPDSFTYLDITSSSPGGSCVPPTVTITDTALVTLYDECTP
jgi:hypothetical protein